MDQRPSSDQGKADQLGRAGKLYEFAFTARDFDYIKELIHSLAGISLAPSKKDLVYSRLARRLRARRLNSFAEYLNLLQSGEEIEREAFTNALTTNMTSFFREAHHFQTLTKLFQQTTPGMVLQIWCCASSSGEEPYSIAITAVDHFKSFSPPVRILATDIDTAVLDKARKGIYALEQLQTMDMARIKKFFQKGCGANLGLARVRPELKQLIAFRRLNLLDERWGLTERFNAIFCRNVMIYFDKPTQRQILEKMLPRLQPDGLFFAGHSENFHHAADLFRVCGKTVYTPRS